MVFFLFTLAIFAFNTACKLQLSFAGSHYCRQAISTTQFFKAHPVVRVNIENIWAKFYVIAVTVVLAISIAVHHGLKSFRNRFC
ncbi:hypothetical protein Plhal703r1_c53g0158101 [Plasmopara halstedii]